MGEIQNQPFQLSFNASLKVELHGSRVTSDGGLILVRELDESRGFGDPIAQHRTDSRRGKNTQLPLTGPLRQSVYSRIAGYREVCLRNRPDSSPFWGSVHDKSRMAIPEAYCRYCNSKGGRINLLSMAAKEDAGVESAQPGCQNGDSGR
jgi:hypothetical protein